jgi:hypothetical protein
MMNRKDFFEYVKDNVKDYLPASFADAQIKLQEVVKNNDQVLTGILIPDENSNIVPTIYLNNLYEQYQDGKDLDACVGDVADIRIEHTGPDFDVNINELLDYENIRYKLQMRICDPELNQERLAGKVMTMHGDFAAYYTVNISENENGIASLPVTEDLMKIWGIDIGQLHEDALAMDELRGPALISMGEMMTDMLFIGSRAENLLNGEWNALDFDMPMFCLSNESKMNGASLILHEGIRKQIGEFMNGDFYILPSSIHETLILPDNGNFSAAELNAIVQEINETQVAPEERLSDKVQFCDGKTAVMENAEKREQRKQMEKEAAKNTAEKSGIRGKLDKAKAEIKAAEGKTKPKQKAKEAEMGM